MNVSRNHFRRTTLIADSQENIAVHLSKYSPSLNILYVGENHDKFQGQQTVIAIAPDQINRFLGQEFDCILFDASDHFNVNAFTAIIGTLVGGGELILNLPLKLEHEIKKGQPRRQEISPLLYRFVKGVHFSLNTPDQSPLKSNSEFLVEQQRLIEKINRCALGHAKRPLVITANRGRGKSASLGMAAADLANQQDKRIIITAPRKANLEVFFQYVIQKTNSNHPQTKRKAKPIKDGVTNKLNNILYIPPDRLLKEKPLADLLIVDEAGAIPVQMLQQMVSQYNRVVLSTTVDGYEGNGRGFDIRFKSTLIKKFPQWRNATLEQPMRWPVNDPLEKITNTAFLLNSLVEDMPSPANIKDLIFQSVAKSKLLSDESLLKQIYGLLVDAHYQTRPGDLDRILSDDSLIVFIALCKKQVVATALISIEGDLSIQQCHKIERSEIRLPGHLLPQSLMAYQGIQKAGEFKFWRIMRIAVSPECQRKKIASRLISYIERQAASKKVDILGSSFSLYPDVIQFWYQLGFSCNRIALRKDSSTGSPPGEFIKLIDNARSKAKININAAISRFEISFYYSMSASYSEIQPEILLCIIKNQCHGDNAKLSTKTKADITRYIEKARSFEMIEWQLSQLTKLYFAEDLAEQNLSHSAECLLVARILQKKPWKTLVEDFEFDGKKTAQQAIRHAITELAWLLTPQ